MTAVNKEHIIVNVPQCDAWTLQQHAVVSGDLLGEVRQQRDVDVAQTSSLTKHHEIIPVRLTLTQLLLLIQFIIMHFSLFQHCKVGLN